LVLLIIQEEEIREGFDKRRGAFFQREVAGKFIVDVQAIDRDEAAVWAGQLAGRKGVFEGRDRDKEGSEDDE